MTAVRVRGALPAEAAILAEMANDLNDHVGIHGRPFTPERVLADGFGPAAAFTPLVAELDGAVVGYAFFSAGYNTDVAARSIVLHDLFVTAAARGRGVGSALMAAVAAETVRAGVSLEWGVFQPGEAIELIGGELMVAEPQGAAHYTAIRKSAKALEAAFGPGWEVRTEGPIGLDEDSEPEPDVAVVPGSPEDYSRAHPSRP